MKITKNGKYLKTVFFCHSPVFGCNEGRVDEGFNFIFGHIFANIYRKIKTGFYFASVLWLCKLLLYFILDTNNFEQAIISRNYF